MQGKIGQQKSAAEIRHQNIIPMSDLTRRLVVYSRMDRLRLLDLSQYLFTFTVAFLVSPPLPAEVRQIQHPDVFTLLAFGSDMSCRIRIGCSNFKSANWTSQHPFCQVVRFPLREKGQCLLFFGFVGLEKSHWISLPNQNSFTTYSSMG